MLFRSELIRCGSVEEGADGRLRALRRHVVPSGLEEKLITGMVFGLRALASTVAFNTSTNNLGAASRIERLCLSDPISEAAIRTISPALRERIQTFADEMTDLVAQPARSSPGRRVGVGVFYYEDD